MNEYSCEGEEGDFLHLRGKNIVVVGNGCAGAECIKVLRECGYNERIHLFTESKWPIAYPMLTTYYVAGKIDPFPWPR